jgi:hypothetical protein
MENKVASFIVALTGGSFILPGLALLLIFVFPMAINGDTGLIGNTFILKSGLISVLYISSIIAVGAIPKKENPQKLFLWLYSIVFHAGLLIYLGINQDLGSLVFILCMAEASILSLSVIGLGLNIYGYNKSSCA